jgi:enolase
MPYISSVYARQVFDSRGNPTVEVEITTASGAFGRAIVPSGASKGDRESLEKRDGGKDYLGAGVEKVVEEINEVIGPELEGIEVFNQREIDSILINMDGTPNKSKLGANATLAISLAAATAAADFYGLPLYRYLGGVNAHLLPLPFMNILNGGAHANFNVEIQEFMIVPNGATSMKHALKMASEVYQTLKKILKERKFVTTVGDEGGFAPLLNANEEALQLIVDAITKAGYKPGEDISLALDVAASELFEDGFYTIDKKQINNDQLVAYYQDLVAKYPIISIEDGMAEYDVEGWVKLTNALGSKIQLVGDDLFVTNTRILQEGIKKGIANAILIKPNQVGTLTETIDAIETARRAKYRVMISHRSGESEDTFIASLAVALNAGQIKTGSIARSERVAKYNEMLRIEDELKGAAEYNTKGLKS